MLNTHHNAATKLAVAIKTATPHVECHYEAYDLVDALNGDTTTESPVDLLNDMLCYNGSPASVTDTSQVASYINEIDMHTLVKLITITTEM